MLKLKRTLYGLRQSWRAFWKYVTEKLVKCGMEQSDLDPCLFISNKVICVVYMDNLLFCVGIFPILILTTICFKQLLFEYLNSYFLKMEKHLK